METRPRTSSDMSKDKFEERSESRRSRKDRESGGEREGGINISISFRPSDSRELVPRSPSSPRAVWHFCLFLLFLLFLIPRYLFHKVRTARSIYSVPTLLAVPMDERVMTDPFRVASTSSFSARLLFSRLGLRGSFASSSFVARESTYFDP